MLCSKDITDFNKYIQRQRLYQFLIGINDNLNKERRDILNNNPLPTVEAAYATIRWKIARRRIMNGVSSLGTSPSEIGSVLAMRNKTLQRNREEDDRRKLRCTHCGGSRHTKEECFKLVGYSDWWNDLQKRKAATKAPASRTGGKAYLTTADQPSSCVESGKVRGCSKGEETVTTNQTDNRNNSEKQRREERETSATLGEGSTPFHSLIYNPTTLPHIPLVLNTKPTNVSGLHHLISTSLLSHKPHSQWIFDCGATDTMTFDPCDFLSTHPTNQTHIQTTNGECVPVDRARPVNISPSLHFKNYLLIPSLSHKLLSVS